MANDTANDTVEELADYLPTVSTARLDDDEFTQLYMRQIVREFGDDIDALRLSKDFLANPGGSLEVLIDGLRMGVERVPVELRVDGMRGR